MFQAFVGSVSIAGADSSLYAISGGNDQLATIAANRSKANVHLNNPIKSVELVDGHRFKLNGRPEVYDAVVIAHPLSASAQFPIQFANFPPEVTSLLDQERQQHFHQTVATFLAAKRTRIEGHDVPEVIVCDDKSFFQSRSVLVPVGDGATLNYSCDAVNVYKVFSRQPLTNWQQKSLFSHVEADKTKVWLAYPHYNSSRGYAAKFSLYPGVVYSNAVEWAASAIEMSLIGAKNSALLVAKHLNRAGV